MVSKILHFCGDVIVGSNRRTGGHNPIGGMLDSEGACRELNGPVCLGTGGTVDGALVEGWCETDCSTMLRKRGKAAMPAGPGPMRPGSYSSSA
jgi:hypothetical protein